MFLLRLSHLNWQSSGLLPGIMPEMASQSSSFYIEMDRYKLFPDGDAKKFHILGEEPNKKEDVFCTPIFFQSMIFYHPENLIKNYLETLV